MLFVTEGAVSKWERGVSYPDITLISDICRVLEISEHELITASTDMDTRKMKQEARKFRTIRNTWFWLPIISYGVALITCFICNLAVNHTLSWFFVVLAALICAFTFVPTVTSFFVAPWTAACQPSLSITNSWSLLKLMCVVSVTPSNHLILCHPLLLLPSICPSIRVFSNESALLIRWPKYWSFSN